MSQWASGEEVWTSALWNSGIFEKPASYIVRVNGSYYEALSGTSGKLVYGGSGNAGGATGTDAAAVIQAALNGLTTGRTWKEKVVLKGDLGEVDNLAVSSYTVIEGESAKLSIPANQIFLFKDKSAGVSNIDIRGITLEAVTTARSAEPIGIDFTVLGTEATHVTVENCMFKNFIHSSGTPSGIRGKYVDLKFLKNTFESTVGTGLSYQVYLSLGTDIKIGFNDFYTTISGNCIYMYGGSRAKIFGNDFRGGGDLSAYAVEGIDLEGATRINILANNFYNLNIDGILMGGGMGACTDVNVIGNIFEGVGITHAAMRACVSVGTVDACDRIQIMGNIVDNSENGIARIGEAAQNIANKVEILNNRVENANYPVRLYGNNYNVRMTGNTFRNNSNPPSIETGTLYAKFNEGYTTENAGISTGTGAEQTIAHGLAGDLIPNLVSVVPTETGATVTGTPWADATNIYCTVTSGKAYKWSVSVV